MKKLLVTFIVAFAANLIWSFAIGAFFNWAHIRYSLSYELFTPDQVKNFFHACISAPLWEEVVFRWFPLSVVLALPGRVRDQVLVPTVLTMSCLFGLAHGGVFNIWIQGFGGVILSWIYLRHHSYITCVSYHFLWNLLVLYII